MYYFVDFDGTIIDVSEKFYQTYVSILQQHNFNVLSKERYWELKKNKTPESQIHAATNASVYDFAQLRKSIIETANFQQFDKLHNGVLPVLHKMASNAELILVTLRHNTIRLQEQLVELDLAHLFKAILNADPESDKDKPLIKINLIKNYFKNQDIPIQTVFIGDSEIDILAGKALQSKTVAVLNGMRTESHLKLYHPDYIIPSISDYNNLNII